ncbi:MAG: substrate-binding domain-containing protein [Aliihoeflea sp.]
MSISGLGPHGERAAPADQLALSEAGAQTARFRRFSVALVIHTTQSDWSRQNIAGIVTSLGRYSAALVEIVDCAFDVDRQLAALERLAKDNTIDAVISIPIGNAGVANAHMGLAKAGKTLVLLDNAPIGMLPRTDYASVVSADNFGLGKIAAELLAPHIPPQGMVGVLGYGVDFFATHERELAFQKWFATYRQDVRIERAKFVQPERAGATVTSIVEQYPDVSGIFCVWDVPAMAAVEQLRKQGLSLPMTTVDLGHEVAEEMARGGMIRGIAAQQPYDQGSAAAIATLCALTGQKPPPWMAMAGLPVTAENVVEAFQVVWHAPATPGLIASRGGNERKITPEGSL